MIVSEYEETEWLKVLKKYLTGKALQFFTQVLERIGTSTQQAHKRIWLEKSKHDESPRTLLQPMIQAISKIKRGIIDPEKAAYELFQGVLMSNYRKETPLYLKNSKSDSHYQIMEMLQELWEAKMGHEQRRMFRTQQMWWRDDRWDTWRGDSL